MAGSFSADSVPAGTDDLGRPHRLAVKHFVFNRFDFIISVSEICSPAQPAKKPHPLSPPMHGYPISPVSRTLPRFSGLRFLNPMASVAPKLVDRYIFKQLLDYFLLGVVVFTLIAFFSDTLLKFIREIQKYGIPFSTLLTMVGLQLPRSIALVLPASAFLAVLMVFNQLNNQFEIIAFRMNGISLWRLMVPPILLGLLCSVFGYWINDYVVPWCNVKTVQMRDQALRSGSLPANGNSFMFKTFDENHNLVQMIYVSHYQGRELGDSTIIDLSKPDVMQIFQSRSGTWDSDMGWNLRNVNAYIVAKDKNQSSAGHLESFRMQGLMSDQDKQEKQAEIERRKAQGIDTNSDEQSFSQLMSSIQNREHLGKRVANNTYLRLWAKLTWPLSCLVIILSAVPLSITPPRQGSNRGFIYAIVILFLFYMLYNSFQNFGRFNYVSFGGTLSLPAYLALVSWKPLIVMAVIGIILIQRKSKIL
jgi:lipopolysaccharide export system permease protein